MKRTILAASVCILAAPSFAQDVVSEPPSSPLVVNDIQVEEARNGGGSANMGSSGILAVSLLVTTGIVLGIVSIAKK